jgi:hypothetical protein
MATDSLVLLSVLRAVGARRAGAGYERVIADGFSRDQLDAAVDELRRGGYLEAALIPHAFGGDVDAWHPSVLTERGRHLLEELSGGKNS